MGSGRLSCPERAWIVKRIANVANLETPEIAQTIGLMRMWTCVCVSARELLLPKEANYARRGHNAQTCTHTHTHSHLYMESISKIQDVNSDNNKLWDSLPGKQRITIKCKDQLGKFISQNYSANNNKAPSGKGSGKGRGSNHKGVEVREFHVSYEQGKGEEHMLACWLSRVVLAFFRLA